MTKLSDWELVKDLHLLVCVEIIYSHGTDFDSPIVTSVSYYFCTYQAAIEKHLNQVAFGSNFGAFILFIVIGVASTICLLLSTDCIIIVTMQQTIIVAGQIAEVQDSSTAMLMTKTVPL